MVFSQLLSAPQPMSRRDKPIFLSLSYCIRADAYCIGRIGGCGTCVNCKKLGVSPSFRLK